MIEKRSSAHQLHRVLEVQYKSAWFPAHRIREAMREGSLDILGSSGGRVEVDETYIGNKKGIERGRGPGHKHCVLSLVDRETGRAKSIHVKGINQNEVANIVWANVAREAILTTDEARLYKKVGPHLCWSRYRAARRW